MLNFKSLTKEITNHFRRLAILFLNVAFNRPIVFRLVGHLNRRRLFLSSVFVAYPASEEYALAYVYPQHRHLMRWRPWPVGIFKQNGKWGVTFVISSTESDFTKPDNIDNLNQLVLYTEKIRELLAADQKTFAGILPSVLLGKEILRDAIEAEVTVAAVMKAEEKVRIAEKLEESTPLIILGSKGFIGKRLISKLIDREIYEIDIADDNTKEWPCHLQGRKTILINLTRKMALNNYLDYFWPDLILLNEVYPEPTVTELSRIITQGCKAYHVVGIIAKTYPSFPKAYKGGIPCCAARLTDEMNVIIRKITP